MLNGAVAERGGRPVRGGKEDNGRGGRSNPKSNPFKSDGKFPRDGSREGRGKEETDDGKERPPGRFVKAEGLVEEGKGASPERKKLGGRGTEGRAEGAAEEEERGQEEEEETAEEEVLHGAEDENEECGCREGREEVELGTEAAAGGGGKVDDTEEGGTEGGRPDKEEAEAGRTPAAAEGGGGE